MSEKPPMYSTEGQPPPAQQYPPAGYPQPQPAVVQQPPPAQPYPPAQGQPTTVVVNQPAVMVAGNLSSSPQAMTCPYCQANIVTRVSYDNGLLTWLLVGGMCILGLWPCCLIPLCVNACKDATHTCPNCNRLIGTHKQIS